MFAHPERCLVGALVALLLLPLIGCLGRPAPDQPTIKGFESLSLKRRGLGMPTYSVAVSKDRTVAYEGYEFVERRSAAKITLTPLQFDALLTGLVRSEFASFRPKYSGLEDGCPHVLSEWYPNPPPDKLVVELRLTTSERTLKVVHDHSCVDVVLEEAAAQAAPPALGQRSRWFGWLGPAVPPPVPGPPAFWWPDRPAPRSFRSPWPFSLTALEDRIDRIVGTEWWTGVVQDHYLPSVIANSPR